MQSADQNACTRLVEELVAAKLVNRTEAWQRFLSYQQIHQGFDLDAFVEHLFDLGWGTHWMLEQAIQGHARKLIVGPYVLQEQLNKQGMASVYRARGSSDQRDYAIKILPERNAWSVRLARRQVQMFETLPEFPGVERFLDVGTAAGVHYLVWTFVDGKSIPQFMREQGAFSTSEVAYLGLKLAEMLAVCHRHGLIHGLVKPTNVLIAPDGSVHLLDFGIGAILAENHEKIESMIDTFVMAVSMSLMLDCASPETIMEPSIITPMADQYSLGCTLYYAATGTLPVRGRQRDRKGRRPPVAEADRFEVAQRRPAPRFNHGHRPADEQIARGALPQRVGVDPGTRPLGREGAHPHGSARRFQHADAAAVEAHLLRGH